MPLLPVGRKATEQGRRSRLGVSARLVSRTADEEIALALEIVEGRSSKDAREFLTLDIAIPAINPGEYELAIDVAERESGKSDSVNVFKCFPGYSQIVILARSANLPIMKERL